MKRKNKLTLLGLGLIASVFVVSGCTQNFCSNKEKARIIYAFDQGVTTIYANEDLPTSGSDTNIEYGVEPISGTGLSLYYEYNLVNKHFNGNDAVNSAIDNATSIGTYVPSKEFFVRLDLDFVLLNKANYLEQEALQSFTSEFTKTMFARNYFNELGYTKFYSSEDDSTWGAFNAHISELRKSVADGGVGVENCPTSDFINLYQRILNSKADANRSCITVIEGNYGSYNGLSVKMETTSWGDAWKKGLIEGLVVYPVSWMVDQFAYLFAGKNAANYSTGVPQILSLLIVTFIVRLFLFLVTLKSTLSNQKMSELQPELAKIQQKYPNSNTNDAQKQRLAEEQMRLYKKHGVNPLSSLLVLVIQFPLFIGVWGAMQGSAVLSSGTFCGLELSTSINSILFNKGMLWSNGWWTALVLILLMSFGQFFQMKLPQWMQKARTKNVTRLAKNPAENQQNKTANIVSWVMLIMIIFMGFTLPAAMGVYWFIGAIISIIQTLIMQTISSKKQRR